MRWPPVISVESSRCLFSPRTPRGSWHPRSGGDPSEAQLRRARLHAKGTALGAPFTLPPAHPFNPLGALRACSTPMSNDDRKRLIDAFFTQVWREGVSIEGERALEVVSSTGIELGEAIDAASTKARLRSQSELAISRGVFGVPTMFADGEMFWGVDSLDLLEDHLAGRTELDARLIDRWAHLPASATRK